MTHVCLMHLMQKTFLVPVLLSPKRRLKTDTSMSPASFHPPRHCSELCIGLQLSADKRRSTLLAVLLLFMDVLQFEDNVLSCFRLTIISGVDDKCAHSHIPTSYFIYKISLVAFVDPGCCEDACPIFFRRSQEYDVRGLKSVFFFLSFLTGKTPLAS